MQHDTHTQRVLDFLTHKEMIRSNELKAIGIPRVILTRMSATGLLERVARGLYRLHGSQGTEHESLIAIATKVPQAVFCLLSALQLHELTTQLPREVWIAMPRGSHAPKIDYPPLKMIQFAGDVYSAGIDLIERDQVKLRVYCAAKTVADCFKHRSKIGLDVAIEALKDTRTTPKSAVWPM
jgi:predicted transcriptional regulator of viral defense system